MNKVSIKKNQHYVPQGYLRKFAINGERSLVWQYDKQNPLLAKRPVSIRRICNNEFYYYQRDNKGEVDYNSLENGFSKVENIAIKIITNISPENLPSKTLITEEEHGQLSFYVALMLTRGPGFRDGVNRYHGLKVLETFHNLYENGKLPEPPPALKELITRDGIDSVIKPEIFSVVSLKPMIKTAEVIGYEMLKKMWIFYIPSDNNYFITSDNPVSFNLAEGYPYGLVGPAHPYAELTIPLKKNLALIIRPSINVSKKKFDELQYTCFKASEQQTVAINRRTATAALRYIYSSQKSEEILRLVKSVKNTGQKLTTGAERDNRFSIIERP